MSLDREQVKKAFSIYVKLSINGNCGKEECNLYQGDDDIRNLVDDFARTVDCSVVTAGDAMYLLPGIKNTEFHVSNEEIKREYLSSRADNGDLYLMYAATIVLIGEFYDSYHTMETVRDFIRMEEWLEKLDQRLDSIKSIEPAVLKAYEEGYQYNWLMIIEKWDAINDISEKSKVQDARTISRLSFLNSVKKFLIDQELIEEISQEIYLTEKAKVIVQKYFMDDEHNRMILEFIYQFKRRDN